MQLSSIDIHFLVKHFQILLGSKIDKIYQPNDEDIIISIHITSVGSRYLVIKPKTAVYISTEKETSDKPTDFAMFLRKKISSGRIQKIAQVNSERILKFEISTKEETFNLYVELFSQGNLILTKNDDTILSALTYKKWANRTIRPNIKYEVPIKDHNYKTIEVEELIKLVKLSDKESITKTLALDLGIGGEYSEEILFRCNINKNEKPNELTNENILDIFNMLKKILSDDLNPNIVENSAYPIEFKKYPTNEKFEDFSKAIAHSITLGPKKIIETKEDKNKKKIETLIEVQKKSIDEFTLESESYKRMGETIYENYQLVSDIILEVKELRKKYSWKDLKVMIKENKLRKEIIDISEVDNSIVVEI